MPFIHKSNHRGHKLVFNEGEIDTLSSTTINASNSTIENLTITGTANVEGLLVYDDIQIGDDLEVSGDLTVKGSVNISDFSVDNTLNVGNNLNVSGDLVVDGEMTFTNISADNIDVNQKLNVQDDATFFSNVGISQNLTVDGTLNIGQTTINDDLEVSGNLTVKENATI